MFITRGTGKRATGRFATRDELTSHIWAIQRQQVFPSLKAIAGACGVTTEVVKFVLASKEGLETYLQQGCQTGAATGSLSRR